MAIISNNISLVSLHIPKTAGTTFRTVLKDQLGKRSVAKLDIYPSGRIELNNRIFEKDRINKKIVAIHGHFTFSDLQENIELNENVKFITWLRDPVDRVVSNYRFLNKIIADRLQEKPDENLWSRMGKTLKEFAAMEENQNVMSKFLEGASLDQFSFIGIQNHFEGELKRLEKTMDWPEVSNRKHNVTGKALRKITPETLAYIKSLNAKDVELFDQACIIRANANEL